MKNIVLVGFMGTGKTAIARAVARDLDKEYVSIDELIELREEREINKIFTDDGEEYFRKVEKNIVKEVSEKTDLVVDTGGGVVLDNENMENLNGNSIVICLWADPEIVYERTKRHAHRPLLNVENPEDRIKELLEYRRPYYEKAKFHIDTTGLDIGAVVEQVKDIVKDGNDR